MKDSRPNTKVKVNKPKELPTLYLQGLATGAYFKTTNSDKVFIKTDETFGSGYRCLDISTGYLQGVAANAVVEVLYKNVEITIS